MLMQSLFFDRKTSSMKGMEMNSLSLSKAAAETADTGRDSCEITPGSDSLRETKALVSELCRHFYKLGWVSGTGGSVTVKVDEDNILRHRQLIIMSPSGVEKERMVPEDMYILSPDGHILSTPPGRPYPHKPPKCTDCTPLFLKITHMEMIKGIQGHGYYDELVVPIIENASHEGELVESVTEAAECYHYLLAAALKLHQLGLDYSTSNNHSVGCLYGLCSHCGHTSSVAGPRPLYVDNVSEPSHSYILLDTEGTTVPLSSFTAMLASSVNNSGVKHSAASCSTVENRDKIESLHSLGHLRKNGFQSTEFVGIVFDDVPGALERWHGSGVKVYIYSSNSREAQQTHFGKSNYGDLRKFLCGYFDTTAGSKKKKKSYIEILRTVGAARPSDMLFVTDTLKKASAARAAGLEVIISLRPGNKPLPENHGLKTIQSLQDVV